MKEQSVCICKKHTAMQKKMGLPSKVGEESYKYALRNRFNKYNRKLD